MTGRIIEIAGENRRLSLKRGFMVVRSAEEEIGRVPLADMESLILNSPAATVTGNLLIALSERGIAVSVCGANQAPVAMLWPVAGHHEQARRMGIQAEAGKPLKKRLWQRIVCAKVRAQGAVVAKLGGESAPFEHLARSVRSGDPENIEAQAARRYWPLVMGKDFRRETSGNGANALLNYGYGVLRSGVARAVAGAGLHPTLGIHHSNRLNPLALVDDLMEPFRPVVDTIVQRLIEKGESEVSPEAKRELAMLLSLDFSTAAGTTPLSTCLERLAISLVRAFESGKADLEFPLAPLPLD